MLPILLSSNASSGNTSSSVLLTSLATTGVMAIAGYYAYIVTHPRSTRELQQKDNNQVVSTLTNERGSKGMGLPEAMSQKTIDTVAATAAAVAPQALNITKSFYPKMFGKHKELFAYFNPAHNLPISEHQPAALAASIVAYASNIRDLSPLLVPGGPVMAIAHRHCALNVFPAQYTVVYENVMESIAEVLGSAITPDIAAAWSEAVLFLAKALIDVEESLYQMAEKREGGWSGLMDFQVTKIETVAEGIKQFTFQPPTGSKLEGCNFEFDHGQYLSLKVDPEGDGLTAPRHYTVTSPPGADHFQCTVKKIAGGKVSTYLHEKLQVGDTVQLAAPFGVFSLDKPEISTIDSACLMSAGIGCTPMKNLKHALGDKVELHVHVDQSQETHALRDSSKDAKTLYHYTRQDPIGNTSQRISPTELVEKTLQRMGVETFGRSTFFVCGPTAWMDGVQKALLEAGAHNVRCEVFGSQLATSCPFAAEGPKKAARGKCPFS